MAKFHINKHGVPAPCHAKKGNCPLGGDENHYSTEQEAQVAADKRNKEEYELIPSVSKKIKQEKKKLTPAKKRALVKKQHDEKVAKVLGKYWQNKGVVDEGMVKYCVKNVKYVEIGDSLVGIANSKPSIRKEMWYDDETEGPDINYANFYEYNKTNMPKKHEIMGRNRNGIGTLKMVPQYDDSLGLELAHLTYEDPEDLRSTVYREVSESELEQINAGIEEVQKDYDKRLKSYFKRYGHKIVAKGYWKNR